MAAGSPMCSPGRDQDSYGFRYSRPSVHSGQRARGDVAACMRPLVCAGPLRNALARYSAIHNGQRGQPDSTQSAKSPAPAWLAPKTTPRISLAYVSVQA